MQNYFLKLGAEDALEKYAFRPEQANKILQLAKSFQMPKATAFKGGITGIGALRPIQQLEQIAKQNMLKRTPPEDMHYIKNCFKRITEEYKSIPSQTVRAYSQPKIFPGKGPIQKQLRSAVAPNAPKVPSEQLKMLNAIIKGHELDELKVTPRLGTHTPLMGHSSPDVIFREHNRVTTLPPEYKETKEFMKSLRTNRFAQEQSRLFDFAGLQYGESPRLSRHARKTLSQRIENQEIAYAYHSAHPYIYRTPVRPL